MDMFARLVCVIGISMVFTILAVHGHGRLTNPPSRASMFRFGYDTPPNYSDNQLFCGGFSTQYGTNGGKCGICGDPYNGVKAHEAGGKYATGIIVRQYDMGAIIDVTWQLTANHKGWVEFRICPINDVNTPATHDCLDQYLLMDPAGTSRFMIPESQVGDYTKQLQLPADLTCSQCVLQWRYHAGNNWGTDADGTGCVGCGNQEEFYACADVMIGENVQQVTDPAEPDIPVGNDPNMDDYEDWDWDTTPGMDEETDGVTAGASCVGGFVFIHCICMLLYFDLV